MKKRLILLMVCLLLVGAGNSSESLQRHNRIIERFWKRGKIDQAIVRYERLKAKYPSDGKVLYGLGYSYLLKGQEHYERAKEQLKKAIELEPSLVDAWFCLACIYEDEEDFREAIFSYKKMIELSPDDEELHNFLGLCYSESGDFARAAEEWKIAIKLNPEFAEAYNNLGTIYAHDGPPEKAISSYEKAISLNPKKAVFHYNLALSYESQRRIEEALDEYRKAIGLEPANHTYSLEYAGTLYILKRWDEALSAYKRALRTAPDLQEESRLYTIIGSIYYYQKKKISEAVACWKKALELDSQNSRATFLLKKVASKNGSTSSP